MGRVYQQTFVDTYPKVAFAKHYDRKTPLSAADLLNDRVAPFFDSLKLFGMGYSWGGYESLIVPSKLHRTASPFDAEGPLIRIHAGLEDAGDLIADLEQGFANMRAAA